MGLNVAIEQREFVELRRWRYAAGWQYQVRGLDGYAGVYAEPLDGYVETATFTEGAVIERIWWR